MTLRLSAIWALVIGLTLAGMEVRANWGDWQFWPFWLVDFVASGLLLTGAIAHFRDHPKASLWLAAGWAFTLGMAWMSFGANLETGPDPARDERLGGTYLLLVASLLVSACLGLLLTLLGQKAPSKLME